MHVLVTGATGFVGRNLVPALLAAGHDVRVLVRDPERYDPSPGVEVATGDLLSPGSFDAALDGVDAAYYLVHSMHAGADFDERDRRAARNFRAAATGAGVDRVVYLGGLGGDEAALSTHLRSRRTVEHVLAAGEYALTTLRAAIIVGAGSASFRLICDLATRFPLLFTPRAVTTDCHPIAIADVVDYLVGVLETPETAGGTYEIGGPEVLTYAEILRRTSELAGSRPPRLVSLPALTPARSSYWVALLTDVPASVARPLVHGLDTPVVADDDRIRDLVPTDLTSFETAVERATCRMDDHDAPRSAATDGGAKR